MIKSLISIESSYKQLKAHEFFYKHGFLRIDLEQNPHFASLYERCKILLKMPNKNWHWECKPKYKYNGDDASLDLINKSDSGLSFYDISDISFLLESGLFDYVRRVTGRNLNLVDIKYRISMPGRRGLGAKALHRDSNFYRGVAKYYCPPPVNLHIYPRFEKYSEGQLYFWEGSHHLQTDIKLVDKIYSSVVPPCVLNSSNTHIYLVDTAALHQVMSPSQNSFRLMYSFLDDNIHEYQSDNMRKTSSLFKELRKEY